MTGNPSLTGLRKVARNSDAATSPVLPRFGQLLHQNAPTRKSPIKGNVKRNISPSARCRNFFVSRHSAQLFERALSRDARVVFLRPSRLSRSGV